MKPVSPAWKRVRQALQRDWAQTRRDLIDTGANLRQSVVDTVKQARGRQEIPALNEANPTRHEPAVTYGFDARNRLGGNLATWNDETEAQLERDWNASGDGRRFTNVREELKRGWHSSIRVMELPPSR